MPQTRPPRSHFLRLRERGARTSRAGSASGPALRAAGSNASHVDWSSMYLYSEVGVFGRSLSLSHSSSKLRLAGRNCTESCGEMHTRRNGAVVVGLGKAASARVNPTRNLGILGQ